MSRFKPIDNPICVVCKQGTPQTHFKNKLRIHNANIAKFAEFFMIKLHPGPLCNPCYHHWYGQKKKGFQTSMSTVRGRDARGRFSKESNSQTVEKIVETKITPRIRQKALETFDLPYTNQELAWLGEPSWTNEKGHNFYSGFRKDGENYYLKEYIFVSISNQSENGNALQLNGSSTQKRIAKIIDLVQKDDKMLIFGQVFVTKNEIPSNAKPADDNELFLTFQLEYFNLKNVISKCSVRYVEDRNSIMNMNSSNHLFYSNAIRNNSVFPLSQEQVDQLDSKISELHESDHMEAKKKLLSTTSKGIRKLRNRLLPKEAKEFLKGWFYKNFAHPYPQPQEKLELVKRTGLSLSQVNSWFYKARVRIWKSQQQQEKKTEVKPKRLRKRKKRVEEENSEPETRIPDEEEKPRIPLPTWRIITPLTVKDFENDSSSEEEISDEFYQKLHSVREEGERQRRLKFMELLEMEEKQKSKPPRVRRRKRCKNSTPEEKHYNNTIACTD